MEAILEQHGIKLEQATQNTRKVHEAVIQIRIGVTKAVRRFDSVPYLGDTAV